MAKKRGKKPRSRIAIPKQEKRPRVTEEIAPTCPTWRVAILDIDGPFGWASITPQQLRDLWDTLRSYESMTWHAIDRHSHCHFIEPDTICAKARARLREIRQDDAPGLYSLKVNNQRCRVWGLRVGTCLNLLWWDPEHRVYPAAR